MSCLAFVLLAGLVAGHAPAVSPSSADEKAAPAYRSGPGHAGYYPGALVGEKPGGVEAILFAATAPYPPGDEEPQVPAAIVAMNAADGDVLWRRELTGRPTAPTVAGGLVLLGSDTGGVQAIEAVTGAFRWSYETKEGVLGQPVVSGNVVYFGDGAGHRLHAVSLDAGEKQWAVKVKGEGIFSPVRVEGESLYAFSATHHAAPVLYGFESARGRRRWQVNKLEITPLTGPNDFELAGDLLIAGVSPNRYRKKSEHNPAGGAINYLVAFDRASGEESWRTAIGSLTGYAPAVAGGKVVCYARRVEPGAPPGVTDRHLLAHSAEDGVLLWSVELGASPRRWATSSPTIAGGLVYSTTATKAFAHDLETGMETWQLPARSAVLAVAGEHCFVAIAGGALVAVDARTGSSRWRTALRPVGTPPPGPSCPGEIAPLAVAD